MLRGNDQLILSGENHLALCGGEWMILCIIGHLYVAW